MMDTNDPIVPIPFMKCKDPIYSAAQIDTLMARSMQDTLKGLDERLRAKFKVHGMESPTGRARSFDPEIYPYPKDQPLFDIEGGTFRPNSEAFRDSLIKVNMAELEAKVTAYYEQAKKGEIPMITLDSCTSTDVPT